MMRYVDDLFQTFPCYMATWKGGPIVPRFMRRLSTVDDTEGKKRVIGILDYWSQSLLKPFHDHVLHVLERIPQDCAYGQDIGPFGDETQNYYSIDLTAATDRFPVSLQRMVVEHLMGRSFSDL